MTARPSRLSITSWIFYDFANTIFSMNVISLYFALWVTVDKGGRDIFYSITLSSSMLLVALSMPVFGAISDQTGERRRPLTLLTVICCIATALIGSADGLIEGLLFFFIANYCYQSSMVFYNGMLADMSQGDHGGVVSGLGVSAGYLGAIGGLIVVKPFVAEAGRTAAFLPTAAMFLFFALPCFIFVRDPKKQNIAKFHMDIAASIQKVTEEIMLLLTESLRNEYGIPNLCLAGGVALNCVANGKILEKKIFDRIWIQPAAGDAGGSIGSALAFWHKELNKPRTNIKDQMKGSYLGPSFSEEKIEEKLKKLKANFKKLNSKALIETVAQELANSKTVGWFQGRMEFGPRALGARSILADPRSEKMQKELNLKVKFRESFRPFAPSVLREDVSEWFELDYDSPYMLLVSQINESKKIAMTDEEKRLFGIDKLNVKRSSIPAITHVDYSARVQTVHKNLNSKYYDLIKEFKKITNCPVLVNTSFNVRGEPIVCSIEDAFNCFMGTNLDVLACGNFLLYKEKQDMSLKKNYKEKFSLD